MVALMGFEPATSHIVNQLSINKVKEISSNKWGGGGLWTYYDSYNLDREEYP